MIRKAPHMNYATGTQLYGMTAEDYNAFKAMLTGIESPGGILKKRVRVYFTGVRTTLKYYLRKYFNNYFHSIDDDGGRVVLICDSEATRDNFAAILKAIQNDAPYTIPVTGGSDNNPEGGDDGNNNSEVGSGNNPESNKDTSVQSKTTVYLIIAGVLIVAIVLVIKFIR